MLSHCQTYYMSGFLMFSGCVEREQQHGIGKSNTEKSLGKITDIFKTKTSNEILLDILTKLKSMCT